MTAVASPRPRSAPKGSGDSSGRTVSTLPLPSVVLFNLVATPNFASLRNLQLQLVQVAPVVIVALGMALVIGTAGIDLSVGAVMALAAAMVAIFVDQSPWLAIAMALVAGVVAGLLNGSLVAFLGIQPIIATLGLFVAGRGIALAFTSGRLVEIFDPTLAALGQNRVWGVPIASPHRRSIGRGDGIVGQTNPVRPECRRHRWEFSGGTRRRLAGSAGAP